MMIERCTPPHAEPQSENYFAYRFTRQSTFLVFLFNWIVQTWAAFDGSHID